MVVRILIALILLLSVLNIVGQPAKLPAISHTNRTALSNQKSYPASLTPIIKLLSAFTLLLLSQNYLNRQLAKIRAAAIKAKISRRLFYPPIKTDTPVLNPLQQG